MLAIGAAAGVAWLLPGQGVLAAAAGTLLLCAVFAAALLLSGAIDERDRQLINRVLGRQLLREVK